ncbi:MAG: AAA+-type ATPase, SpoVK/Ycf46/Vps4 family [Chloroflexi bacterium AL-W]|nr:AAA+-type ATPase, SpoVK/Ycf46/Vps4 family [Chloroflexi bacterium AL-N1]NOK70038.1 AAA+-type ATPase, SpoVK/Ycf46/Vps4 family [Chloroflexi bacterium AL-N10]NOK77950.1 AAA+-type ATPase, SpoVK/Ycf46/Vps4 family [Chloroflexi bacterium AL-N5]NOK84959.1 AAA+-type ATPase, SpoVK/Ycf46/Vps4 family [Chloroflexi bacterium AL-W]NOK91938.1 AAA+-type ATPase, SpoVK/Ycf46/Vps4 family [Chloroflexi bacterium AL-N15]
MANGKILRQLIKAGATGDSKAFRRFSEAIIEDERQKQHHLLANDLEQILYGEHLQQVSGNVHSFIPNPPLDKERGLPLLDIRQPKRSLEEIILPELSMLALEELLEEHRRSDILRSYGMKASNKAIFYGPPGCGKTLAAEVVAFELDRPLAIVRLDALVSSFLGETAANLRKVFDFITENLMVVLFDEFDAIGKERDDQGEHGELRRVVNAVLQMMDAYQGRSLILAATNHEQILDAAIWRRFDEIIEFPLPSVEQIGYLLSLKLRGIRRQFDLDDKEVISLFSNNSGADIERTVRRSIKRMILRDQEFLTIKDLKNALLRENQRTTTQR